VALDMDRLNTVMSAPRVTVRALMRRGWSQPDRGCPPPLSLDDGRISGGGAGGPAGSVHPEGPRRARGSH
jgi:hypothetical protein